MNEKNFRVFGPWGIPYLAMGEIPSRSGCYGAQHSSTFKSTDWFKGKSTGNHRFSHEIWGFPVFFPLNQSIDTYMYPILVSLFVDWPTQKKPLLKPH